MSLSLEIGRFRTELLRVLYPDGVAWSLAIFGLTWAQPSDPTPTALRPRAQGWRWAPTLGQIAMDRQPQRGCGRFLGRH